AVPELLRVTLDLGVVVAQPLGALVDDGARLRLEGDVVQAHRVAVVAGADLRRLGGADADRGAGPAQVPDRLAALALDLADPVPAERPEQITVERQAPLDRADDQVQVVHAGRSQQASLPAVARESCRQAGKGGAWCSQGVRPSSRAERRGSARPSLRLSP